MSVRRCAPGAFAPPPRLSSQPCRMGPSLPLNYSQANEQKAARQVINKPMYRYVNTLPLDNVCTNSGQVLLDEPTKLRLYKCAVWSKITYGHHCSVCACARAVKNLAKYRLSHSLRGKTIKAIFETHLLNQSLFEDGKLLLLGLRCSNLCAGPSDVLQLSSRCKSIQHCT